MTEYLISNDEESELRGDEGARDSSLERGIHSG